MRLSGPSSRVPALDGVRALAIALVFSDHLARPGSGWYGVDLFFALSGFLITTILLGERDKPHFWKVFYTRRVTRILPPFLLLLALSTAFATLDWPRLWPWLASSLSNLAVIRHTAAMRKGTLGVLWSLSVEEHFYLLWPIQVRRFGRKVLLVGLTCLLALEPVLRTFARLNGCTDRTLYFLTPFHLDAIVLGCMLAVGCSHERSRNLLDRASPGLLPLAALCGAMLMHGMRNDLLEAGFKASLIGLAMSLCVANVVLRPKSLLARFLSFPPLPWIGTISYGLYLYHELIWVWAMNFHGQHVLFFRHGWAMRLMTVISTMGLAWFTFTFIETPIMAWGRSKAKSYHEEAMIVEQTL